MSTSDEPADPAWIDVPESPLETLPTFELTFAYDDPAAPETVTVFPETETTTTWISIEAAHALSLEDAR